MLTVLAVVAQAERTRLAERILDSKGELRRAGRHQGRDAAVRLAARAAEWQGQHPGANPGSG